MQVVTQASEQIARQYAAAARNRSVWLNIIYNVKDYGLKGDGSDDTSNLQLLINDVRDAGGGIIQFPDGDYVISHVNIYSNITLRGNGYTSRIKQKLGTLPRGSGPGQDYYEGDGIITCNLSDASSTANVADNENNITIQDLWLEGNSVESGFWETMAIIGMQAVSNVLIERCKFVAPQGDAIAFYSGTTTSLERHCENLTIRKCEFDGVNYENRQGISFYDVDGALVEDCSFTRLTKSTMPGAIDMEGRDANYVILRNITIRNNSFKNIGAAGDKAGVIAYWYHNDTLTKPHQNVVIEGNSFENCRGVFFGSAVGTSESSSSNNIMIRNNSFYGINQPMEIYGVRGVRIEENVFENMNSLALQFGLGYATKDLTVERNTFKQVGKTAGQCILIYVVDGLSLSGNTFIDIGKTDNTAGSCIDVPLGAFTAYNIRIVDNKLYATTGRMKYLLTASSSMDSKTARLRNNTLSNTGSGAATLMQANEFYGGDERLVSHGYNAWTVANVPNDFPVGITGFTDFNAGFPGSVPDGWYETYIVPRQGASAYKLSRQHFYTSSATDQNKWWIRYSNDSGTAWGAWKPFTSA